MTYKQEFLVFKLFSCSNNLIVFSALAFDASVLLRCHFQSYFFLINLPIGSQFHMYHLFHFHYFLGRLHFLGSVHLQNPYFLIVLFFTLQVFLRLKTNSGYILKVRFAKFAIFGANSWDAAKYNSGFLIVLLKH